MTVYTDVDMGGGILSADFDRRLAAGIDRAKVGVAGYGMNVLRNHSAMFRYEHPSREPGHPGYWERQLRSDNVGEDIVISDRAVYREWLEGTGSRNSTSRFKGYRMWRRTKQQLNDRKGDIAAPIIDRAIG